MNGHFAVTSVSDVTVLAGGSVVVVVVTLGALAPTFSATRIAPKTIWSGSILKYLHALRTTNKASRITMCPDCELMSIVGFFSLRITRTAFAV